MAQFELEDAVFIEDLDYNEELSDADKLVFTQTCLSALVAQAGKKLRTGMLRRENIRKQLEKGGTVDNYRTRFVRRSASEIIDTLKRQAMNFNSQYSSFDACSLDDLVDILIKARDLLKGDTD